jgi:hypothetical protein
MAEALSQKQHALVTGANYFITHSGSQTGILSSPAVGYVATTPALIVANVGTPSDPAAKRINLDYLNLVTTVVGSAASGLVVMEAAVYADTGNRYVSGGTEITQYINSPHLGVPQSASQARVFFGALLAAVTPNHRALCPLRIVRPAVSASVADVIYETKYFNFGGITGSSPTVISVALNYVTVIQLPPVSIGPGESMLFYLWQLVGATPVAATYVPELGWWES